MGKTGKHTVQVVKNDVLVGGDRGQTGRVVPRLENPTVRGARQLNLPKQLARGFSMHWPTMFPLK